MMAKVKICGLTREEDVAAAVGAGADALGFITGFPKSPRNLSLSKVGQLLNGVPPFVDTVLVTTTQVVERSWGEIKKIQPAALQLYGDVPEPKRIKKKLGVKLIRPFLVGGLSDNLSAAAGFDALLSDTYKRGRSGGTGMVSDWGACRRLRRAIEPIPFILSGGLNPDNVAEAIRQVGPYAVDASSGLESLPGVKDHAKVRAFVRRAAGTG